MRTVANSFKWRVIAEVNTRTVETALTSTAARAFFKLEAKGVGTVLSAAYHAGFIDRVLIGKEHAYFRLNPDRTQPPLLGAALDRAYRVTHDTRHMVVILGLYGVRL